MSCASIVLDLAVGRVANEDAEGVVVHLVVFDRDVGVLRVTEVQPRFLAPVSDVVVEVAARRRVVEGPVLGVVGEHHVFDFGTNGVHEERTVQETFDRHVLEFEAFDRVVGETHTDRTEDLAVSDARVRGRDVRGTQERLVGTVTFEFDEVCRHVDVLEICALFDVDLVARFGRVDRRLDRLALVHPVRRPVCCRRCAGDDEPCHRHANHRKRPS